MQTKFAVALALCVLLSGCSWFDMNPSIVTTDDLQNDYVWLFKGGNLKHWVNMGNPEGWVVTEGVLHSDGGKGGNWLRSTKQYTNFSLKLDYKVSPGGNSGVFIRCTEAGNPWETGFECQISNEQPPRDDSHCTGSLYGYVAVDNRPNESPDEWHSYEIICKNNRILVLVDGRITVDADQSHYETIKDKSHSGYIGLQDSHTSEGHYVQYRNIRIREL